MPDREGQASVEVTPEMVHAGIDAYMDLLRLPEFTLDQVAEQVFTAMRLVESRSLL